MNRITRWCEDDYNGRSHQESSSRKKQYDLQVEVGEPWPDELEVDHDWETERSPEVGTEGSRHFRDVVHIGFACFFACLMLMVTTYAMATGNQVLLDHMLTIVESGLLFIAVWSGGRAALEVLRYLRQQ
jgi:hypothetical protein